MHAASVRLLPLVVVFVCTALANARASDTRGREFFLTFPPNFHNNIDKPNQSLIDSLYIFIAATEPTTGRIVYRNADNTEFTVNYTITDPSQVYTFGIPWIGIELRGFNDSGTPINYHQSGSVAPQSFRITSSTDVAVYALNRAETTSDAMLVLPTDVLGTQYRVMAYNSDFRNNEQMDTPSQLAIVATRNNTIVTVRPTVPVVGATGSPISVLMDAGESYLLQAAPGGAEWPDLTGTLIESNQPIAVFGGHQRTRLPVQDNSLNSRDYLIEQIPPLAVWGKSYILTPFPPSANQQGNVLDMVRVVAANNNTQVVIGGALKAVLAAGGIYETSLQSAALLTASDNVLVAQYKQTSRDAGPLRLADPFMIIVPPRKQFLDSYLCINAQSYADERIYFQQYMTLICHRDHRASMRIDNMAVDQTLFRDVPGTCYTYAWVPTTDGSHFVNGDHPFGLYVYGYGTLDSYGYTGGMAFRTEEENRVEITQDTVLCLGDSLQLSISGGSNYKWAPAQGLSCVDCPNPIAAPQTPTTYTVSFTDAFDCTQSQSVFVDVQPYPVAMVSTDTSICSGESVVLKASGGRFYQWSPAEGLSCVDCPNPTASPRSTTTYRVVVSNGGTCEDIDSVEVAVRFLPVEYLPSDTLMCAHDSIAFDLPSEGFTYKWMPATGLSCTTCPNPVARPSKTTKYTVVMTSDAGCRAVRTVTVTVVALPIVSITPDLVLCSNAAPVRLLAKGGNYYSWSPAEGLSCTDCASPSARPTATTTYTVTISITNTCSATTTITISVPPTPIPVLSPDTALCLGQSAALSASGGVAYSWSPAEGLSCTDCASPVAQPTESTVYTVAVTNGDGCTSTASVRVDVIAPADISTSSDTDICAGSSATLSASGGIAYSWSPAEGLSCTDCASPVASPAQSTLYTVAVLSASGCTVERSIRITVLPVPALVVTPNTEICRGRSTTLQASGGALYEWWPASGLSCTDCATPVAAPTTTTQYFVRALQGSCSRIDSVLVTVLPCDLKGEFSAEAFPPLMLCDTRESACVFRNTGEDPITITGWQLRDNAASSFVLNAPGIAPPHTLYTGDSLVFAVEFQPQTTGALSAFIDITTQDGPVFSQQLSGEGYKRTVTLSLGPDISSNIGDTIALYIAASCDNWSDARVNAIRMDISYPTQWLAYGGTASAAATLDASWGVTAEELPGSSADSKKLRVYISGAQHLTANGTVATVYVVPFLTTQQVYTPNVLVSLPERETCLDVIAEATTIDVSLCAPTLRPVRYSGTGFKLRIEGGTAVLGSSVEVQYGVAFQARSVIELYDGLGQLLQTIDLGAPQAGNYAQHVDMQQRASGLYIVRYNSGPYSHSIPFMFTAE